MKERNKPLSEKDVRLMSLPILAQTYIKIGETIEKLDDERTRMAMRDQRWQMYNRMTPLDREQLYSYETFLQDEISRKNGKRH